MYITTETNNTVNMTLSLLYKNSVIYTKVTHITNCLLQVYVLIVHSEQGVV